MERKMFCFQCEQTAGCSGCMGNTGVCGKTAATAKVQDKLTGSLIGLAKICLKNGATKNSDRLIREGLFMTLTNVNFNDAVLKAQIDKIKREAVIDEYDMDKLWSTQEDIRSLKSLVLFGLRGVAAYAYHAAVLGYTDDRIDKFFHKGLAAVGEEFGMDQLLPLVMEVGEVNLICMELLDRANRAVFGVPAPAEVTMTVEKGTLSSLPDMIFMI